MPAKPGYRCILAIGSRRQSKFLRPAFSLLEVVIAVLIIGILSAIAIPRYLSQVRIANDQTHKVKLMLLRDAIERYIADHDRELPPSSSESAFKSSLENYLGPEFPSIDLAFSSRKATFDPDGIRFVASGEFVIAYEVVPTRGWQYDRSTGRISINVQDATFVDPSVGYDQW